MAYAALTSLAGVIQQILPHDHRYISLCGKDQMESLHEKVSLLQEFLEYTSSRSFLPEVDVLESRIRDTAYKMEDTIELVVLTKPGKESESEVQLPTQDEFASYFEEFHVLLEETGEMKKNIDKNAMPGKHPLATTTLSREAPGFKGTKVGLDEALNKILDQVLGQKSSLRIVPITGMGGIGKTTLARASYEDPLTLHHFDVRFWVTVSQDYNIQDILRGFLPKAEQDNERLIEHVHKHLKSRRYLIVLDDMWDEKVWDRVRNAFPDDKNGSRVILTTRLSGVASYVGSSSPVHEMEFLNEDQSWELLRENVYGHEGRSSKFEDIGRLIAKNCKGLPLAVVVIAGLLKFNKTREYWEQVARNTDEKVTTRNDHLFGILSWSYTRLPPHLKACFLYMGTYKEDFEIPAKELVRLWAAEGFLKPTQSRSTEEVAEECLEKLVERSLVMVTKRWLDGKIRTCSVHDVIREVSIRKAEEENFIYHFMSPVDESTYRNIIAVQRRVSFSNCDFVHFPPETISVNTHSLIDYLNYSSHIKSIVVQHFKLLRVLNKVLIEEDSELSILCTLTNLRYLHFVCKNCADTPVLIPKSISGVQNLETLIVSAWGHNGIIVVLPSEIWKLQRLRHIIVETGEIDLLIPSQGCHVLSSLQTLSGVSNISLTKSFVERIPNLKKLKLKYTDEQVYTMENLQYLYQLEELSIICYNFPATNFVFPQSLKKLSLYDTFFKFGKLPPIGLLPNLKVLKLKSLAVVDNIWEPIEGEFLQLEHLKMEDLNISDWSAESIHFPRLRKLVILNCTWLKEIPESIGEIDTLGTVIVKGGKEEAKTSVQKIKGGNCKKSPCIYRNLQEIPSYFQNCIKLPRIYLNSARNPPPIKINCKCITRALSANMLTPMGDFVHSLGKYEGVSCRFL